MAAPADLAQVQRESVPVAFPINVVARLTGIDAKTLKVALDDDTLPHTLIGKRRYIPRTAVLRLAGLADLTEVIAAH